MKKVGCTKLQFEIQSQLGQVNEPGVSGCTKLQFEIQSQLTASRVFRL